MRIIRAMYEDAELVRNNSSQSYKMEMLYGSHILPNELMKIEKKIFCSKFFVLI